MEAIIAFIQGNDWAAWVAAIGAVLAAVQVIVRLTPTPKDDVVYNKAYKVWLFLFSRTNEKK